MRPGEPVLIDDGAIEAVVETVTRTSSTSWNASKPRGPPTWGSC